MAATLSPICRFDRALFVIGHMRCGSTALSNILCSRPDISGYGEAHVPYRQRSALGVLLLNQVRRRAWRPRAHHLFDKILHSRYDGAAPASFFAARAIFVVRAPVETIRSIRTLFGTLQSGEYATDALAADYYEERLGALGRLWEKFPDSGRVGTTHEALVTDPAAVLARISARLGFDPPLVNHYVAPEASRGRGAGDPLASHRFDRIVPATRASSLTGKHEAIDLSEARIAELDRLYRQISAQLAK